ncbi:hypothetical protein E4T50_08928 [Aureobasidium sp. EXF-12298]|nr:hypothetical protein E4T50_08928 [Aureobasidium sp. EXF-12298]
MAAPNSILIIGSGVFGLSTAYALSRDSRYSTAKIVLVDRWNFEPSSTDGSVHNPTAAHADTSRVIRRDYPYGPYAALACEARARWKAEFGENQRYVEQRLLFAAEGSSVTLPKQQLETINYIKDAYNISSKITPGGKDALKVLDSLAEIRSELGISSHLPPKHDDQASTLRGYVSEDCGWADAGTSIEWLRQEVICLGRVQFQTGEVESLIFSTEGRQVQGVKLGDGTALMADLTVVAAGSQSPKLLGIPDLCEVSSDVVAYIQLSQEEADELRRRDWPLLVNAHRGVFAVGPDHENCFKLGHFSRQGMIDVLRSAGIESGTQLLAGTSEPEKIVNYGYGGQLQLSETGDVLDVESDKMLKTLADYRIFLLELLGPCALDGINALAQTVEDKVLNSIAIRPFTRLRKCWYTDTPTLDFIVDFHPSYGKSLFVATGGGDHAFKFLPIIGEKVVALASHHPGVDSPQGDVEMNPSLEELRRLWKFPAELLR